jgi:tRNA(Ile)-lysidine synthase
METRWPAAGEALARSAQHMAEAQQLLEDAAAVDLAALCDGDALSVPRLRGLGEARRSSVLRAWISRTGAAVPSATRLAEASRQMLEAAADRQPAVRWGEYALRRYRDRLFLTRGAPPRLDEALEWRVGAAAALELGAGLGRLRWVPQRGGLDAQKLPAIVQLRARRGGERLKPAARASTTSVQHLCQSHGVLPWMRDALPLLYAGDALIAVADLWLDARWMSAAGQPGLGLRWEDAPSLL